MFSFSSRRPLQSEEFQFFYVLTIRTVFSLTINSSLILPVHRLLSHPYRNTSNTDATGWMLDLNRALLVYLTAVSVSVDDKNVYNEAPLF